MTTTTKTKWQDLLTHEIERAKEYDRRGDVTLRNQVVRQLLCDENGIPLAVARKALREAGLIRE